MAATKIPVMMWGCWVARLLSKRGKKIVDNVNQLFLNIQVRRVRGRLSCGLST